MLPSAVLTAVKSAVESLTPANPSTPNDKFVLHIGTRQNSKAGRIGYLLAQPPVPIQPGRNCSDRLLACTLEFIYAIPAAAVSVADLYSKALDDSAAVGNCLIALPGTEDIVSVTVAGGVITDDMAGELTVILNFDCRYTA